VISDREADVRPGILMRIIALSTSELSWIGYRSCDSHIHRRAEVFDIDLGSAGLALNNPEDVDNRHRNSLDAGRLANKELLLGASQEPRV
jgi:hypothetical protein